MIFELVNFFEHPKKKKEFERQTFIKIQPSPGIFSFYSFAIRINSRERNSMQNTSIMLLLYAK